MNSCLNFISNYNFFEFYYPFCKISNFLARHSTLQSPAAAALFHNNTTYSKIFFNIISTTMHAGEQQSKLPDRRANKQELTQNSIPCFSPFLCARTLGQNQAKRVQMPKQHKSTHETIDKIAALFRFVYMLIKYLNC